MARKFKTTRDYKAERDSAKARRDAEARSLLAEPSDAKDDGANDGQPPIVVAGSDDSEIKRVAIPVNADGRIVVELLTDKAKSRLTRMMNDPAVRSFVDPPASVTVSSGDIDPAITGVLYDAIGSLASSIAVATGHTVDSAKLLAFTAEEKSQLAAPTAAVLSKYSGAWAKWQDEIGLGLLLTAIVQGKLSRLERRPGEVRKFPQAAPDLAPGGES
jgi:hypothetical protein